MSWHYRILRHPEGWLALHEVYCDDGGKPHSYTTKPARFGADEAEGQEGIVGALEMALKDARERPVLDASEIVAGPAVQAVGEKDVELIEDDQGMTIVLRGALLRACMERAAATGKTPGALVDEMLGKALAEGAL